jgi:hypothetical protein
MIEQLDAVPIQEQQKIRVQAGLRLGALLATDALRSRALHDPSIGPEGGSDVVSALAGTEILFG